MEIKGLKIETEWCNLHEENNLTISRDGVIICKHLRIGGHIDDTFEWIEPLLHKVYALGKKDGYLEGLRDGDK
jgi:hypothetical protein